MEPFLGEIRLFAFTSIIPSKWLPCAGQVLPITQFQALYALLGNQYGGDGRTNFVLPDLRGRVPVGASSSAVQGSQAGSENITLTPDNMAAHSHILNADSGTANGRASPAGCFLASAGTANQLLYGAPANMVALDPSTFSTAGGGTPHTNMQPFLTLQYCISTSGVFPSRQ